MSRCRPFRTVLPIFLLGVVAMSPVRAEQSASPAVGRVDPGARLEASPRVLLVAQNAGTEITDLLVPWAVLAAAGANVTVVAPEAGSVQLWPQSTLEVETTLAEAGPADLIVVPAVRNPDDGRLLDWLAGRNAEGVALASICDGVLVLAEAGLLDGRSATGHFYSHDRRARDFPAVQWVRDRRWVEDEALLSSAGVSASGPAAVRLVERLFGPERAGVVARRFGIDPGAEHRSADFRIGAREVLTAVGNFARGLRKRTYVLPIADGVDEYSLAFTIDMLVRTSRARVLLQNDHGTVRTAFGLQLATHPTAPGGTSVLLPHAQRGADGPLAYATRLQEPNDRRPADAALEIDDPASAVAQLRQHLGDVFGGRTAEFVATQLELPAPR